jgi:glutamine amidotransferase
MNIVIVDYRMGNTGSIINMLKRVGATASCSSQPSDIGRADKLILPGVGAFDHGMSHLRQLGLIEVLTRRVVTDGVPVLGICLGLQLLSKSSEEGTLAGLGWVDARTVRFAFGPGQSGLRIPHMGWNTVTPRRRDSLFRDLDEDHGFYFVHSYHLVCAREEDVLATAHYGYDFACAVQHGNILGTQFHPEKSHRFGKQLLKNFVEL